LKAVAQATFGPRLKALREASGFTQEELATIAGLSVHAVSALERGYRRRPQSETIRALAAALDLDAEARDELMRAARSPAESRTDCPGDQALPVAPTPLLGRDAEMRVLRPWLDEPSVRLVTLTGPGGAGKTRLALELARAVADDEATRVLFVPLASARTPAFVASAIVEALESAGVSTSDLRPRVPSACDGRPTLLVLDNLEQVLDAAPLIADLLMSDASLKLLATSRAPLRVRGEREYAVGPLAMETTADAGSSPALDLFVARVRDVRPDFVVTDQNRTAVLTICRLLDALPLALELAAPWMKVLTADELARRLAHDCLLPSVAPRDLPERQQTMMAAVAWSYQLLAEPEREVFQRLGALPGQFSIEAAAAVLAGRDVGAESTDWAIAALGELIDKSLLRRVDSPTTGRPLYRMLETVRAYAALELAGSGERDDVMEGLARFYAAESTRFAEGVVGRDQVWWLDKVRDDLDVYRVLIGWLVERDRADEAAHLAVQLMFFWAIRGHAQEGVTWYEQILAMPLLSGELEGRALRSVAVMWYTQGELSRAADALRRALDRAREAGDAWTAMQAENMLGHVEYGFGNMDAARARFATAVVGFRTVRAAGMASNALCGLAWVALAKGDVTVAEELLEEADEAVRDAGPWFLTLPLYLRAIVAIRRGQAEEAIGLMRESLMRINTVNDRFVVVYALVPLAAAAVLLGHDEWAARILGARDAITELSGARPMDPSVRDLRDQAEQQVRERLGPDRWMHAYSAGRRTTIATLLEEIDTQVPALRE
jgi:predicted ATPase/transcriptional regulator with XRE-family HTH domain